MTLQASIYYDTVWAAKHMLLVWLGCFTLYVNQLFPSGYIHLLHKTSVYLGNWAKTEGRVSANFFEQ